jgi:precorrin-6B methylase 1
MAMNGSIVLVGTGIQWAGQTTLAAQEAIRRAGRVLFAVVDPNTVRWIRELNPAAESLPYPPGAPRRRAIYEEMVERILTEARQGHKVCAVFYGHPGVLTRASHETLRRARREGIAAQMLPGVSALDCLFCDLGLDPGDEGCQTYEATDFLLRQRRADPHTPLVLWQVGLIGQPGVFDATARERIRRGLALLAEALGRDHPPEHEVIVYEASSHPLVPPRVERLPLARLAEVAVTELSTLFVPSRGPAPVDPSMLARLGLGPDGAVLPSSPVSPDIAPRDE